MAFSGYHRPCQRRYLSLELHRQRILPALAVVGGVDGVNVPPPARKLCGVIPADTVEFFYNNISEEEIQKYIDQLKTLGYAEEASASESVSTGVLLRKDETWISIAYSEGGFGIRISVEKS